MRLIQRVISFFCPPRFPDAADVVAVINNADVREGFRELPDSPEFLLSNLREWSGGRATAVPINFRT